MEIIKIRGRNFNCDARKVDRNDKKEGNKYEEMHLFGD